MFMGSFIKTEFSRDNDGYEHLLSSIHDSFDDAIASNEPLFTTAIDNLYDIFLSNLSEEARQHYNCRACRHFVNRYGGLVTIDDEGYIHPVMWRGFIPEFFHDSFTEVREAILASKVDGVFLTSDKRLGVAKTGEWEHMYVDIPKNRIHKNLIQNEWQAMAQKKQDFQMLLNAALKYDLKTIETAVNLLQANTLYRSEKVLGIAEWFLDVETNVEKLKGKQRTNYIWKKSATAPAGFCHVSSSMIGTLLDDIEEGMSIEAVKARFANKMNPTQYQCPQVAPAAQNVARAEEIVAKLGIANSLKRRFARLDELNLLWQPREEKPKTTVGTGVFSGLKTKEETRTKKRPDMVANGGTMTWDKFQRTVLPNAVKIELYVPHGALSYAALVTAEDPSAPPIIQWDTEENRNPVSWYLYSGGSWPTQWNLPRGGWTEVTGITLQPNLWQPGYDHQGQGLFFILKNCKDTQNKSSGLFPEILRGELREVRATIESYSRSNALSGYEEASACGRLLQSSHTWTNCEIRVTTNLGVTTYKLDRWD
jgi:hypothetical protein